MLLLPRRMHVLRRLQYRPLAYASRIAGRTNVSLNNGNRLYPPTPSSPAMAFVAMAAGDVDVDGGNENSKDTGDVGESLGSLGQRYDSESNQLDISDIVDDTTPEQMYIPGWVDYLPTEYVQDMLDFMHNNLDLPWVSTIALATVAVRLSMLPLVVAQARYNMRLAVMQPYLQILHQAFKMSKEDVTTKLILLRKNLKITFDQFKFSPIRVVLYPLINIPIFVTFIFGARRLVLSSPEFQTAGCYWFVNLQAPDPYMVLPAVGIIGTLVSLELGLRGRRALHPDSQPTFSVVDRLIHALQGLVLLTSPMIVQLPAGVFPYWIASSAFTIVQILMLRRPGVRKMLGIIPPLHLVPASGSQQQASPGTASDKRLAERQARRAQRRQVKNEKDD